MTIRSPLMNVMVGAARRAARGLVRDYGELDQLQVSQKGPADFVTTADRRSEKVLMEELARGRPQWGFISEERGHIDGKDEEFFWVIDPLDGTTNLLHGIPHFCISIGVKHRGEIVAGVVYDPLRDEIFVSEKGSGAFMNDRRLRVSARQRLIDAVLATGIPHRGQTDHDGFLEQLQHIMAHSAGVRRMGAAALDLAYVAAGRYDGFWETGLKAWDVAAGILLVREAGGLITDYRGGPGMLDEGAIVASNSKLHPDMLKLLKNGA